MSLILIIENTGKFQEMFMVKLTLDMDWDSALSDMNSDMARNLTTHLLHEVLYIIKRVSSEVTKMS